ncbi:inner membrane translocase Tim44 [Thecamonas trahens ATCC 50062]|uniref:Inner membrane translocase Tim44 n=1 Tax=Thecamonas trahens ATCC 50062 TaxID=461836 RepID=A0A0L0DCF5_THETB|nr:inner membrane translocase Tim44 [Thecamonas trahens ATCC 50062]KNC49771.1 inner membrane translocase Tim44 [Thecamonas trahens ATCC 50062]|eukprot:XP_013757555.1 inner membrane translocase Tim44 [Thecamonas trahens ATCC 50062]
MMRALHTCRMVMRPQSLRVVAAMAGKQSTARKTSEAGRLVQARATQLAVAGATTPGAARVFSAAAAAEAKGSAGTTGSLWKDFVNKVKSGLAEDKELQKNLEALDAEKKRLAEKKSLKKAAATAEKLKSSSMAKGEVIKDKFSDFTAGSSKSIAAAAAKAKGAVSKASESSVAKSVTSKVTKVSSSVAGSVSSQAKTAASSETASKVAEKTRKMAEKGQAFARDYILDPRYEAELSETHSRADAKPGVKGTAVGLAELGIESPTEALLNRYRDNKIVKSALALTETVRESDNPALVSARGAYYSVADKLSQLSDRLFPETEAAMCYSEIRRLDPGFDEYALQARLEKYTLPEVMEALGRHDLAELKNLVSPKFFTVLEGTLPPASASRRYDTHILHISPLEMIAIKPIEKEPTLFYSFTVQQVQVVRDAAGNVIEGDPDSIQNVQYIWSVQRDASDPSVWQLVGLEALDPEEALF